MAPLYPETSPVDEGMLEVGDGQQLHWQTYGSPGGQPALFLHGGPGSGCASSAAQFFDPEAYRIALFDQRNCGRSLPNAADMDIDLSRNTTWHLVEDIERLRQHLQVESWLLLGTSWGSTLALAYAQRYRERVYAMVLAGVTTTRRSEIEWLTGGLSALFPQEWHDLISAIPPEVDRSAGVIGAYRTLVHSRDRDTCLKAASDWHRWELASILLADPNGAPRRWQDPLYRLTRARIVLHYFHYDAWLEPAQLLKEAGKLAKIPGRLIQGRFDLEAPLTTAWELARVWPESRLVIVDKAAHATANPEMTQAIVAATDEFRVLR